MGILRFRVAAKENIEFGGGFVEFLRGSTSSKIVDIIYGNATGQSVIANQVLYTYLTPSDDGYIEVKASSNQILIGSGVLNLTITHKASATQSDQNIYFNFDSSPISIEISYNSKPVAEDFTVDITNRSVYVFEPTDFTDHYIDFDNDVLSQISISGDITGYEVNSIPYNEGDWISINDINSGLFRYVSLNQDTYYEKDNTWKAKDINGNISN